MAISNCDCCDRCDVPGSVVDVPGEPFACFLCQGEDDPDPYGELEDSSAWIEANGQFGVGA